MSTPAPSPRTSPSPAARATAAAWGAALALAGALAGGCGALDDFTVDLEDQVTVPGTYMGSLDLFAPQFAGSLGQLDLSANKSFSNAGVSPGDVDAIFVRSISLVDSQPMLAGMASSFERIDIFVTAPGQAKVRVASGTNFPTSGTAVLDVVPNVNLKPYATSSSMSLAAEIKLKRRPTFTFTVTVKAVLDVDINLLGV
jgi:hypothetical protein